MAILADTHKKVFALIVVLGVSALLVQLLLYAETMPAAGTSGVNTGMVLTASFVAVGAVCFLGVLLSQTVGLGYPILLFLSGEKNKPSLTQLILIPAGLGVLLALLTLSLDYVLFEGRLIDKMRSLQSLPVWSRLGLSYTAAIGEEILFRLFLMSLIAWIALRKAKRPEVVSVWIGIVISSMGFGVAHLPGDAVNAGTLLVLRAIGLGGIAGVLFGWLYWKKGLEAAMIAHLSVDVCFYVLIAPLV